MYQHHIQLRTNTELSKQEAVTWYSIVEEFGPSDIIYNYPQGEEFVGLEYGICDSCDMMYVYTVPLLRDMTQEEAQFIVAVLDYKFDIDFNIELSSQFDAAVMGNFTNSIDELEIDDEVKTEALKEMSKWSHNRWLDVQLSEGWRYGSYFNSKDKTHPALRDWDSLPESHRRSPKYTDQDILEWLHKNRAL